MSEPLRMRTMCHLITIATGYYLATIVESDGHSCYLGVQDGPEMLSDDVDTMFWIYETDASGASYIATAMTGMTSASYVHNFVASGSSVACDIDAENAFNTSEQFEVEHYDYDFIFIKHVDSGLYLTWTSENGVHLAARDADEPGQTWMIAPTELEFSGVYEYVPEGDTTQDIVVMSERSDERLAIGAASPGVAQSAWVKPVLHVLNSNTPRVRVHKVLFGYPQHDLLPNGARAWSWMYVNDAGVAAQASGGRHITQAGANDPAHPPYSPRWIDTLEQSYYDADLPGANGGRYRPARITLMTTTKSLSAKNASGGIGPDVRAIDDGIAPDSNHALGWYQIPTNLYDSAMGAPHDITMSLITDTREVPIGKAMMLPRDAATGSVSVRVRCIAPTDALTASLRLQFFEGGAWQEPEGAIEPGTRIAWQREAPLSQRDGSTAWAPTGFLGSTRDADGRATITEDFALPHALFSEHPDATACRLILSLASFRYSEFDGLPGLPYVSRSVSTTALIEPYLDMWTDEAVVKHDGIHIPAHPINADMGSWTGGDILLDIRSLVVSGAELLASDGLSARVARSGDEIVIPFDKLADATPELLSGSGGAYEMTAMMYTGYAGTKILFGNDLRSELAQFAAPATVGDGWGAAFYPTATSQGTRSIYASYQRAHSERGTRYVAAPRTAQGGRFIASHAGSYFGAGQQQASQGLVIWRNASLSRYEWTLWTSDPTPQPTTALVVPDDAGTYIIPLRGNIKQSFTAASDHTAVRHLGATRSVVEGTMGVATSLEFSGTIYADAADSLDLPPYDVPLRTDVEALFAIDADTTCLLRTAWGTEHVVRLVKIDAPRSIASAADISLEFVEV